MKILTFNTWQERGPWKERWEVAFKELEHLRPDFACFQELFNAEWALKVRKRLGLHTLLFPKSPAGLTLYARPHARSWGMVELAKSRLEEYRRFALWSEFKVKGSRLVIVNTHLSWKLEDGASRLKQVEGILDLLKEKAEGAEAIVTGDLNAPPHSPEIRKLTWEGKFKDIFRSLNPNEERFTWDNRNAYAGGAEHKMPDRRIDYILTRNAGPILGKPSFCDLVFTKPGAKGVWASDHFGILAEFK